MFYLIIFKYRSNTSQQVPKCPNKFNDYKNESLEGSLNHKSVTVEDHLALVNIAKCKKIIDIDVCIIKMVIPYANILKYLKYIFNKLQNGDFSGNVKIVLVIPILMCL